VTLRKCDKSGCTPVEQIRGKMGRGDYADVIKSHEFVGPSASSAVDRISAENLHEIVEMNDEIKDDFRICCLTCGKATGWNRQDAPGMPGAGADYTRKKWNEGTVA
jgi:hypothetical protein